MASEKLQVILELVSGQYKREAKSAATATGQIASSASQAGTATGRLGDGISKAGAAFKGFIGAGIAIKAVAEVKQFAQDAIRAYSDLNESVNAVEVTFGDAADGIKTLGEGAARAVGLSNAEFNSLAVSVSAFAQSIAGEGGNVTGVVDTLTKRMADFASVMNIDVSEAAEKFRSGLAGETEPLRRFGIDLSAATVTAFAYANGIAEAGAQLTEAEKVQARYGALMAQTAKVQGDFANTSGELANKERILNAELENQKALLGESLAPLKMLTLEMRGGFNKMLTDVALSLGHLTGNLEAGRAALIAFENETGSSAKTIGDAVEGVTLQWQDWSYELKIWQDNLFGGTNKVDDLTAATVELWRASDQSTDTLHGFRIQLASLEAQGKLTAEQHNAMREALEAEVRATEYATQAHNDNEHARWRVVEATDAVGDSAEEAAEKTYDAAQAVRDLRDAYLESADPIFGAVQALERYRAAQENLEEVQKDRKATDQEVAAAQLDVAETALNAQAALNGLADAGITQGVAAIADALGVSHEEAAALLEVLGLLDGKTIRMLFHTRFTSSGTPPPAGTGGTLTGPIGFNHSGGRVRRGEPTFVGTHRNEELFIPDQSGTIISNSMLRQQANAANPDRGSASGTVINVGNVYGWDDFVAHVNKAGVDIRRLGLS